jgi:hypothetical protein
VSRKTSLTVNNKSIKLDYFVEGYVYHVVGGILASLKDTGPIKNLELVIDNAGQVNIKLNGVDVPLKVFPEEIIRNTLAGMVSNLKGVDGGLKTLELKITA